MIVTITAKHSEGSSTVAAIIAKALNDAGIPVTLTDDDSPTMNIAGAMSLVHDEERLRLTTAAVAKKLDDAQERVIVRVSKLMVTACVSGIGPAPVSGDFPGWKQRT